MNDLDTLRAIYFPHLARCRAQLIARRGRLVHYTSAEVASSIVSNREIWMRNAATMNDFMEIEYGLGLLSDAWPREPGRSLVGAIEQTFTGISQDIEHLFNSWQHHFRSNTYLTCVSEHDDEEDNLGRLSMWRAYGGDAGIAIVLSSDIWQISSDVLSGVFSLPVLYADQRRLDDHLLEVAQNLRDNRDLLVQGGVVALKGWVFHLLRSLVLSTKHPGFREEREWRVTYSPALQKSPIIETQIACVRGTPQKIHKIPLRGFPDYELDGLAAHRLINRIIVGPTQFPLVIAEAFREQLAEAGINDSHDRVVVSQIPLRRL